MSTENTMQGRIEFGKKLRAAREAAGMSLRELAAESGVDHVNIMQIEKADRDPQLSTILALADALKVPVSVLFTDN